ncbi:MAG: M48 family metallopeptidase [Candidatus Spechtbacterales bacterium]|nr:M48 family metallopeptidase [Candidatus Spechtbacterales bacterium]
MATLYTHKDANIRKTWLIITVFLLLIMGIGWFLSLYYGDQGILIIAIFFSTLMSVGSYWWSDKLVLAMTRAKPMPDNDNGKFEDIHNIVENLAITAGLPKPRLYVMETQAMNAFATGRNPEHAIVAVTTGLVERLNHSEIEGVLAHEMSHIGNRDMLVSTVVVVLAGVIIYVSDIFMRSLIWGGGRRNNNDKGGGALMAIGLIFMVLAPIIATLLRLAVSRKREFLADASGALLTRYPEGLASALEKISQDSAKMRFANNATAHLFFENPLKADSKKEKTSFFVKIFSTHPPVEERLKALRDMG